MNDKMNEKSQQKHFSHNEGNQQSFRTDGSSQDYSQKVGNQDNSMNDKATSYGQSQNNDKDYNQKTNEERLGHSQTMRDEVNEDRNMGNDVERMHTEGDEPNLGDSIKAESGKYANDGSQTGARSSETGRSDSQNNGPFQEGRSQNDSYRTGQSSDYNNQR